MKKVLSFLTAVSLVLISGCTKISNDSSYLQSDSYGSYTSDVEYIIEDSVSSVESVISQIESELEKQQQSGEVTVSRDTESVSSQVDTANEAGKQIAVVDSSVDSADAQVITPADVDTKGEKPLYYNDLTKTQKHIYRCIKSAAENMTEGLFSIGAVSSNEDRFSDITVAFRALSADNPQIFWLPISYVASSDGSSLALSYRKNGNNLDYTFSSSQKANAEKQLNAKAAEIIAEAQKLSSRFEKELYFHDWLCKNVTYGYNGSENCYTAYGALVNGVAVCEGYSRAMQLLCDKAGIPCTVIYGKSEGIGHMWNIINPGDGWYHLDVTWDDDADFDLARHAYFNLTDAEIKTDHTIFEAVTPDKSYVGNDLFNISLYQCTSTTYNYFVKKNLVFQNDMAYNAQRIAQEVSAGNTMPEFKYILSGKALETFLNELNPQLLNYGLRISQYSKLGNAVLLGFG